VYFEKMKSEIPPSKVTFWGFSALENFAISQIFEDKAAFIDMHEPLNISKFDFGSTGRNMFNLTPGNFEHLRPVFKKLKSEEISIGVATDVSSLTFLWFTKDDFPEKTFFYDKGKKFVTSLAYLLETQSFDTKNTCEPWSDYGLNERQINIFKLLIRGSSNKAISELIFQSEKTVEAEISKIAKVLGIDTRIASKENPRVMFGRKYAQILKVI
jgi:DNA-binding CsgD family transcriptional regulator